MKNKDLWFAAGAVSVLLGTVFCILNWQYAPYVFSLGAALVFVLRLVFPFKTDDFRTKRLAKIQLFSSLLLVGSAYFMFTESNIWALTLFLAAVLDVFIIYRFPQNDKN